MRLDENVKNRLRRRQRDAAANCARRRREIMHRHACLAATSTMLLPCCSSCSALQTPESLWWHSYSGDPILTQQTTASVWRHATRHVVHDEGSHVRVAKVGVVGLWPSARGSALDCARACRRKAWQSARSPRQRALTKG